MGVATLDGERDGEREGARKVLVRVLVYTSTVRLRELTVQYFYSYIPYVLSTRTAELLVLDGFKLLVLVQYKYRVDYPV